MENNSLTNGSNIYEEIKQAYSNLITNSERSTFLVVFEGGNPKFADTVILSYGYQMANNSARLARVGQPVVFDPTDVYSFDAEIGQTIHEYMEHQRGFVLYMNSDDIMVYEIVDVYNDAEVNSPMVLLYNNDNDELDDLFMQKYRDIEIELHKLLLDGDLNRSRILDVLEMIQSVRELHDLPLLGDGETDELDPGFKKALKKTVKKTVKKVVKKERKKIIKHMDSIHDSLMIKMFSLMKGGNKSQAIGIHSTNELASNMYKTINSLQSTLSDLEKLAYETSLLEERSNKSDK